MKIILLTILLLSALPAHALTLLGQAPDPSVIITRGNLEWVWASPCAGEQPSCDGKGDLGDVLPHGFAFATDTQWNASFVNLSTLIGVFAPGVFPGQPICAAPYFSQGHDTCDLGDLRGGAIWHSPLALNATFRNSSASETFLVRQAVVPTSSVPEPISLLLLGMGIVGVLYARRLFDGL